VKSGFWLGNKRSVRRRNLMETVEIEREGR
jgi:hypothetical protein